MPARALVAKSILSGGDEVEIVANLMSTLFCTEYVSRVKPTLGLGASLEQSDSGGNPGRVSKNFQRWPLRIPNLNF